MKKSLSFLVILFLALSVMPMVLADGASTDLGGVINATQAPATCYDPEITVDHTARGWFPNDQTYYTAEKYGVTDVGGKYDCGSNYTNYIVPQRQNYVFTGETVDYYVLARDLNGKNDIANVQLMVGADLVGACAPIDQTQCTGSNFSEAAFGVTKFNWTTDQVYVCKLIVPDKSGTWANGQKEVKVKVTDGALNNGCAAKEDITVEADLTFFNPTLSLMTTGSVNFGNVYPGTVATSSSVYLKNVGLSTEDSGVIMDIYIASADYFTDPTNGNAICGTGNGIRYDRFSYYATKGSVNSGSNNNTFEGLGRNSTRANGNCIAKSDEFTVLPSHSGQISDMCRVINWNKEGSLLAQGAEMSITFRLDVPTPCSGSFTNGKFHFVGRVV